MAGSLGVEIVVRDCTPERVVAWLDAVAGPLAGPIDAGGAAMYATRVGPVVVQPGMGGPGGVGVWFNAGGLPWASHAACARQAARELGCIALCDPGEEYPEVHPLSPVFLEVSGGGERLVVPDAEPGAAADTRPHVGFPGYVIVSAAGAAELGRSAKAGALTRREEKSCSFAKRD